MATSLDWSRGTVGDPAPCVICHRPALCRSPDRGVPCHKACAEAWLDAHQAAEVEQTASLFHRQQLDDVDEL